MDEDKPDNQEVTDEDVSKNSMLCKSCGVRQNTKDFEEGEATCYDCKQEGKPVIPAEVKEEKTTSDTRPCHSCGRERSDFALDESTVCNKCIEAGKNQPSTKIDGRRKPIVPVTNACVNQKNKNISEKLSQVAEETTMTRKYKHSPEWLAKQAGKVPKAAKKGPKKVKTPKAEKTNEDGTIIERLERLEEKKDDGSGVKLLAEDFREIKEEVEKLRIEQERIRKAIGL